MAPNLAAAQHDQIRDMILNGELTDVQMAPIVGCSERSIQTIRLNIRLFATTRAPRNGAGRPRSISPPIEKLLSAMTENQYDEEIKDSDGNSAWYYISVHRSAANYQWLLDLRENNKFLLNGARTAQPGEIFAARSWLTPIQKDVCLRMNATLAQFYISNDGTSDFLEFQRQDVYAVVYDDLRGMGRLFERNLRRDDDKRATCHWVHLPVNNELWTQDIFSQQLRRIDNSTALRRVIGTAPFNRHIIPGALRYKQTYVPHPDNGFTPVPSPSIFSNTSGNGIGTSKKTVTALFLFGYETHMNRKKLTAAMKGKKSIGNDETALLIGAYFPDELLHCHRTLDQFTYDMLDDTERRDNTQVMSRWTEKEMEKVEKAMRDRMLKPPRRATKTPTRRRGSAGINGRPAVTNLLLDPVLLGFGFGRR